MSRGVRGFAQSSAAPAPPAKLFTLEFSTLRMVPPLPRRTSAGRLRARFVVSAIALLSIFALDCRAHGSGVPSNAAQRADRWSLTFEVSGGFAGFDRRLYLTSAGLTTASDRRRRRDVTRQLSPDELTEIDRLVASAASLDTPGRTACRDCLTYAIDIVTPNRRVSVRATDQSVVGLDAETLVRILSRLLDRMLAEP